MMDHSDRVKICLLGIEEVRRCETKPDGKVEVEIRAALQYENKEDHEVVVQKIPMRFREPKLLHPTTTKIVGTKRVPANATVRPPQGGLGDWLTMEFNALPDGGNPTCGEMLELLRREGLEVEPPESIAQTHWQ